VRRASVGRDALGFECRPQDLLCAFHVAVTSARVGVPASSDSGGSVPIGSVLDGRYRIDAVLGTGGMGRVYRGEHTGIGRKVAIKVLHAHVGRNKEATQRFQREALASGRLDHPNIVTVSDFGVLDEGSLYLVMEALEGEPLGTRLERDKRLSLQESLFVVRGMLAGLRHAHDRGVVHRDIKPDNVYLAKKDGDQIVKILDFGIAKLYAGNADDPATTRAGLTVGTPAYLSPEQAVGGAITPASDLYSVSIVLYEMLMGRTPYAEDDPLKMLTAHVGREPPPFHEIAPDVEVPPGLEAIVRHGLAKVSGERIGSAQEYLRQLEPFGASSVGGGSANSSSLLIPAGPHSQPLTTVTPMLFESAAPSVTPMPTSSRDSEPRGAPTSVLTTDVSRPTVGYAKRVSIAEHGAPIPKTWMLIAAVSAAVAIVLAIVLVVTRRGEEPATLPPTSVPFAQPAPAPAVDRDVQLKAALYDLEDGKTCGERRAAVAELTLLADPRAIPELKRARYRGTGGVLGVGESNSNSCLIKDADALIKQLGGK
jgi:serine/threonine-protein kinase